MELESFIYKGINYRVDKIVELRENCYQIRTLDHKIFIFQFNETLFRWIITETEME